MVMREEAEEYLARVEELQMQMRAQESYSAGVKEDLMEVRAL